MIFDKKIESKLGEYDRLGNHSDLNPLTAGNSNDAYDCIKGFLASSIAMVCFFFIWIAILTVSS
jgi:hypothetical protein